MIRQNQLHLIRTAVLDKTMNDVAKDLGVNRMRVKRYETGESYAPSGYLNDYAARYGIGFESLEPLREFEKALDKVKRTLSN
ncbi:hypothetical protein [Alkalihalobacillus sp. AL-G]|uniref:hypothetical protein n=1 Tax=Alkalihalobacillus sp. AL-G TaxID=2926399 RepID=UPI00272B72C7|nr:hypothetical protein [Alkalihalobacillus sp. AL-G]WLD91763.1 hypothetical protein MOJ78_12010 [Alkalihalobacillus sp. AL-G]